MNKYPDFMSVVLGKSPGFLFGFLVIACIGAIALIFSEANKRDPNSPRSPVKFSMMFWLADNALRIIGTILLMFLAVRAAYEYVPPVWMLFVSIGIGLGSDKLALIGKRMGILTTDKLAAKINEKLAQKEGEK